MKVELVYAPAARVVFACELDLEPGCTLDAALSRSGWLAAHPELASDTAVSCGIWGRKAARDTPLRERDRVEFWRELRVDPKVARRERFQSQGARSAGLFTRRRPGAKSGY